MPLYRQISVKTYWTRMPIELMRALVDEAKTPYSRAIAEVALRFDFVTRANVSINDYSKAWGWSHKKVKKFLSDSGFLIERETDTTKKQNQRGTLQQVKTAEQPAETPAQPTEAPDDQGDDWIKDLVETSGGAAATESPELVMASAEYIKKEITRPGVKHPRKYAESVLARLKRDNYHQLTNREDGAKKNGDNSTDLRGDIPGIGADFRKGWDPEPAPEYDETSYAL